MGSYELVLKKLQADFILNNKNEKSVRAIVENIYSNLVFFAVICL